MHAKVGEGVCFFYTLARRALNRVHSVLTHLFALCRCHEIKEVKPTKVKNIGIWIRYDSRSGSHNA